MSKVYISPSMMCADISTLKNTLDIFEKNDVDYLHIDIMDGSFVPNFTLGTDYCRQLHKLTNIPLDIHLMIKNPESKLEWFDIKKDDFVSVHYESTSQLQKTLSMIRNKGAHAMAALNPATPIDTLKYVLDDVDGILVMTVNPGFAGQKLIPATLQKIHDLRIMLKNYGCENKLIEVDGNVSLENAKKMRKEGADIFVGGTAGLFINGTVTTERINNFKNAILTAK